MKLKMSVVLIVVLKKMIMMDYYDYWLFINLFKVSVMVVVNVVLIRFE